MSLRTRPSSLPQLSRPTVRSRIPIARIPQPQRTGWPRLGPGQAGSDCRRAPSGPVTQRSRLVRCRYRQRRRADRVSVAYHRRPRGDLVAKLGSRPDRGAGSVPEPRGAAGQVSGDGRHHVLPLARPRVDPERRSDLEPLAPTTTACYHEERQFLDRHAEDQLPAGRKRAL